MSCKPFIGPYSPYAVRRSYLGVYEPDAPGSYTGIDQFSRRPSAGNRTWWHITAIGWWPFDVHFATAAAKHGAVTLRADRSEGMCR